MIIIIKCEVCGAYNELMKISDDYVVCEECFDKIILIYAVQMIGLKRLVVK